MRNLSEEYKDRGVVVLAVNNGDTLEKIKEFFEKEKFTFRPVRQKAREISDAYKVSAYPTNCLIGPDGKIAEAVLGFKRRS